MSLRNFFLSWYTDLLSVGSLFLATCLFCSEYPLFGPLAILVVIEEFQLILLVHLGVGNA